MSDERPASDSSAQVLRDSLGEIRQSLDALADRLQRLEATPGASHAAASADSSPAGTSPAGTSEDRDALSVGQEILAIPSSGLEPGQVFSLAMDRVARLLSADRAMLFVWEPDGLAPRGPRRARVSARRSRDHLHQGGRRARRPGLPGRADSSAPRAAPSASPRIRSWRSFRCATPWPCRSAPPGTRPGSSTRDAARRGRPSPSRRCCCCS